MNKTQDRKTKHFDEFLNVNGELLRINSGHNKGVYTEIIKRFVYQLDIALSIHRRLLVHRVDLHTTYYSPNNKIISRFMNRAKQWIKRNYGIDSIGYIWAREQERAKHQHYHLALFVDANKVRHPAKLISTCEGLAKAWELFLFTPKNCYYLINRNDSKAYFRAFFRLSYLSKERGKGYKAKAANDYSASRIKQRL